MAIEFVGRIIDAGAGYTTGTSTLSLSALSGGLGSTAQAGDLVIAAFSVASTTNVTLSITDGTDPYTLIASELYSSDTYDSNLRVAYKRLTSSGGSVVFGPTGSIDNAGAIVAYVLRGVSGDIFDSTATSATGTNGGRPTPPAVTVATAGAWVVCVGAGAAATGANYTTGTLSSFATAWGSDTNDAMLGIGYVAPSVGTYTPVQFGGGSATTSDSWTAISIALRPAFTYNESVDETSTATEELVAAFALPAATADGVDASDSVAGVTALPAAQDEAVVATETVNFFVGGTGVLTETATATEALSAAGSTFNATTAETATATETSVSSPLYVRAVAETVTAADAQSYTFATSGTVSEAVVPVALTTLQIALTAAVSSTVLLTESVLGRLLWELVDDSQNANWQNADTAQDAGWATIDNTQSPGWSNTPT